MFQLCMHVHTGRSRSHSIAIENIDSNSRRLTWWYYQGACWGCLKGAGLVKGS